MILHMNTLKMATILISLRGKVVKIVKCYLILDIIKEEKEAIRI